MRIHSLACSLGAHRSNPYNFMCWHLLGSQPRVLAGYPGVCNGCRIGRAPAVSSDRCQPKNHCHRPRVLVHHNVRRSVAIECCTYGISNSPLRAGANFRLRVGLDLWSGSQHFAETLGAIWKVLLGDSARVLGRSGKGYFRDRVCFALPRYVLDRQALTQIWVSLSLISITPRTMNNNCGFVLKYTVQQVEQGGRIQSFLECGSDCTELSDETSILIRCRRDGALN